MTIIFAHLTVMEGNTVPRRMRGDIDLELGKRIKFLRMNKGITQGECAKSVDTARTHIANVEAGKTYPSYELFISLAKYFEVSLDYLAHGEEFTYPEPISPPK